MTCDKEGAELCFKDGRKISLPLLTDNMGEEGLDISGLRKQTGVITYDPGYVNTGSCQSGITYIDGEKGVLRYRGYNIEDLVKHCDFVEVAYLLIKGELPNLHERQMYQDLLNRHSLLHVDMRNFFRAYPANAHPMSILAAMVASLSAFYQKWPTETPRKTST